MPPGTLQCLGRSFTGQGNADIHVLAKLVGFFVFSDELQHLGGYQRWFGDQMEHQFRQAQIQALRAKSTRTAPQKSNPSSGPSS